MAHMIDTTTGTAAIAYAGETPWHGLGQQLEAGASIEEWRRAAGLEWEVLRAPVLFQAASVAAAGVALIDKSMPNRDVLYRSDTLAPLSVVSRKGYKIHQPEQIFGYFESIAKAGGFELETAGALSGGGRIWALARVGEGANIIGQDRVDPYLLLATSYDGTMTTIARFTSIRVVCHNTITAALSVPASKNKAARIVSALKLPHSTEFDAAEISAQLGIVQGAFDQFLTEARSLAEIGVADYKAAEIVAQVLAPTRSEGKDVSGSRGFKAIMGLFDGAAIGSDLTGGKSAWQLLNAVTEYVDHQRGRTTESTLTQAWFGSGEQMKTRAKEALLALV
jgi:phage/plasmid-like protein (TIGR03299 family)